MFTQRPKADTKVGVVKEFAPRIGVKSDAIAKMFIYVNECKDEVGWLGTANYNEKERFITIEDVYLFDQEVHATTTEITPEGLSDFAQELLSMGDEGMEIWNNLKMWGHSHVNMSVSPSGQDDRQMETFREGGHDWFIRLIANKKGDMKLDLYDYNSGIVYLDLPWVEIRPDEESEILQQINNLYRKLDEMENERVASYEVQIKEEMKKKVRKISYAKKTYVPIGTASTEIKKNITEAFSQDVFKSDQEVYKYFGETDLLDLSTSSDTLEDMEEELQQYGYFNFFSPSDLLRIFKVARQEEFYQGGYHYEY